MYHFVDEIGPDREEGSCLGVPVALGRCSRGSFFFLSFFFNVYLFLRESTSGGGAEREGEQRSQGRFRADGREPDAGLEPTNREIMT